MSTKYVATATREGRWWVITVPNVGVTQSRSFRDAEAQARDLIAVMLDVEQDTITVEVVPQLEDVLAADLQATRAGQAQLQALRHEVATQQTRVAARLESAGYTGADIAGILAVSPQRVSQLLAPDRLDAADVTRLKAGRRKGTAKAKTSKGNLAHL